MKKDELLTLSHILSIENDDIDVCPGQGENSPWVNKKGTIIEVRAECFYTQLNVKCWLVKTPNDTSPLMVIKDMNNPKYKYHANLILTADTSYPIVAVLSKESYLEIVDGFHRLSKFYLNKYKGKIKCKLCDLNI